MSLVRRTISFLSHFRDRAQKESDLDQELRAAVDLLADQKIREGMNPAQALRSAHIEIGGLERLKETVRCSRAGFWADSLLRDISYGFGALRKSPALTVTVVLTLALGIGVNTAVFGVVNGFLLRPLQVRHPEQIVALAIQQKGAPVGSSGFSYPEFVDFRDQTGAFSNLFGLVLGTVEVAVNGQGEASSASYVSRNFFTALGVDPAEGRLFFADEAETPGEPLIAVLGNSYWQKRFDGSRSVIGQQVKINGRAATIVGVVPRRFQGMYSIAEMDVYLPLSAIQTEDARFWSDRDDRRLLVFGRLGTGVDLSRAQSSLDLATGRLARQYPATDKWFAVRAVPERLARPIPYANDAFLAISGFCLALAALVLLLACMNVENVLLASGMARLQDMAIRAALGAPRARLIRQLLAESILLAILGGTMGMLLGLATDKLVTSFRIRTTPIHIDASFDWRLFVFGMGCAVLTGVVVGLVPAIRASTANLNAVLVQQGGGPNSGGTQANGFRNFLVVAQVAGSVTLLVTAGLVIRGMQRVQATELGFDPDHLLNLVIDPHQIGYDEARTRSFYSELEARVAALPGVTSASLASYVPMGGTPNKAPLFIEAGAIGPGEQPPSALFNSVDASYFDTLQVRLLEGRTFSDADDQKTPAVAVVNQTMARSFWGTEDPVGKYFRMNSETSNPIEVIGVVRNGKYRTINEDPQAFFYVPLNQSFAFRRALQIRTAASPEALAASAKKQINDLAPSLALLDMETMNQSLDGPFGFFPFRLAAALTSVLGTIGLILAAVGVYAVVCFTAHQRTREIGIRMALGSDSGDILKCICKQGLGLVLSGVLAGMAAAWIVTHVLTHALVGTNSADPSTYLAVAILMLAVGWFACWLPARKATRADPMVALRHR